MMAGLENRVLAYVLGGVLTAAIGMSILFQFKKGDR
jgi:hypothetical protein